MVDIVKSGGWLMLPIILCGIIAMGIILERFWTLQQKRVIPEDLTSKVWGWVKKEQLDQKQIQTLHQGSALGQILAAGLTNRDRDRTILKDAIEDTGRHVVHELERYLESLGTVAAVSPLLGLLGTVIGMGNDTMMTHPIHLHGMWSELETGEPDYIPRKHTLIVQPGSKISYLVTADAMGSWAYHCHLLYHMPGMFRKVVVS